MDSWVHTALAEAAGGATAGLVADSLLYAVDSAKVRSQARRRGGGAILFRGLASTVLLGSVPVFGSFFFCYAPLRDYMQSRGWSSLLPVASAVCAVPATIIGVPADVVKKRLVLGMDPTAIQAARHVVAESTWRGLFAGWHVNLVRDLPFAGVKIGLYEISVYYYQTMFASGIGQPISSFGASLCGVASGVCCAILTCPLDVVNTRMKAGMGTSRSISKTTLHIARSEGIHTLFRGVATRSVVLGLGSSIFWPIQNYVANFLLYPTST